MLAGVGAAAALDGARRWEPRLAVLAGGSFLGLVGAIDDRKNLKPATKVVVQLIAAAVAVVAGYQIRFFRGEILNLEIAAQPLA
jgi:UDP-N-acetylmuramyl pentapeptide phosphotransferase/UDP-N-acetylglucosamine-1-phosphate transferase